MTYPASQKHPPESWDYSSFSNFHFFLTCKSPSLVVLKCGPGEVGWPVLWCPNVGLSSPNTNSVKAAGVRGVMWEAFAEAGVLGRCQFNEPALNELLGVELLCFGQGVAH